MQSAESNMLELISAKISNTPEKSLTAGAINTFLNPYSYLQLRKDPELLEQLDSIMIDGGLLVTFLNKVGIQSRRNSFDMTSLAPIIFKWAVEKGQSIYMVGAQQSDIEQSVAYYREEYPLINIIGYRNGYFSDDAAQLAAIEHILTISPDILIVGMGAVRQEQFLVQLKNTGRWRGVAFTCGGFFHQTAKKGITYYPPLFDRLNLRWLYRMIDEPALMKRYFFYYPLFVGTFLIDCIKWRRSKSAVS